MAPKDSGAPPHVLPHFRVERFIKARRYSPPLAGRDEQPSTRNRAVEGARLSREFSASYEAARQRVHGQLINARRKRPGVYVEVQSMPGEDMPSLVWMQKGVRIGAVRPNADSTQTASVFVPDSARDFVDANILSYAHGTTDSGNVPLQEKFESLASFRPGSVTSLWTDQRQLPEDRSQNVWWECWTWSDDLDELRRVATLLGFTVSEQILQFPDIVIVPLNGSLDRLDRLVANTSAIEQLRYASDSPVFFTKTVFGEQKAWVDDLVQRLQLPTSDSPAVCLLDTGVARAHPLLEGSLAEADCLTLSTEWGTGDSNGHGTKMSGAVLFSDLTAPLSGTDEVTIPFILESVKLVPPARFPANEPASYGSLTQAAVALAEINAPHRERTFCMAITSQDVSGETPTSWSAALDQICAGVLIGGEVAEPQRRLFFVSAGNIRDDVLPEQMDELGEFPIEDPAQSWNAVSVGGYTNKSEIHPDETDYADWSAFALAGALSPFSRISTDWEHSRTPVKPEIVFEAGNRALSPNETELLTGLSSLSLLTTSKDFLTEPLEAFWATSPATAQAAGMAGRLMSHDPSWWPETIRALMIHNASWTPWMITRLEEASIKADKVQLARHFGYGVPSLERSLASAENDLCMISQSEIQPYFREPSYVNGKLQFSAPKLHHMHIYDLPWPVSTLQDLREQEVQLRVTLSYYVEPNLGDLTPVLPGKYRSCGLRFEMKRDTETEEGFLKRVNSLARDAASTLLPAPPDPDWLFGNRSISAGSIHSDIWSGPGATLALRNKIIIIPVGGWWKDRVKAKRFDASMRYTLILSITSKDNEATLYSEVQQLIGIPVDVESV